jgi:enoyl-CoA hydratase
VLTGDHRIGTEGAFQIGLNEVAIGMPVPVLAMELARDRLSRRQMTNATLLAKIYDPETAVAAGYLDEVVAPDQVLARATKARLRGQTIKYINAEMDADMRDLMMPSR